MGLSRWQGRYNTVGVGGPRFIPVEKTGISIRTCPLLRIWIMLSVHRHYRSWNDKANELRAGRWVRDPLSLNQLTSRPLLCVLLGVTVHWLRAAWDLNSSVMYKASCALNRQLPCDWGKSRFCGELWKSVDVWQYKRYNSYEENKIRLKTCIKYCTCSVDRAAELAPEIVERKGGLSSLPLLTLILHNPLDQHSHDALPQPAFYWHKSTTNYSDVTYNNPTLGSLRWQNKRDNLLRDRHIWMDLDAHWKWDHQWSSQ